LEALGGAVDVLVGAVWTPSLSSKGVEVALLEPASATGLSCSCNYNSLQAAVFAPSAVSPEECNLSGGLGGCVIVLFGAVSTPLLVSTGVETAQQEAVSAACLSSTCNYKAPSAAVCVSSAVLSKKCYVSGE